MSDIEVAGLVTKLSIDDSDVGKTMAGLNREMNLTKSQFAAASAGLNDFGRGTEGLRLKSDSLTKQLGIQGTRVAKLQQEHAKAVQEKGKDAVETQKLEMRLNKAVTEYNKLEAELRKTNRELAIQSSRWTQVGNALDAAGTKLQAYGKKMETAGKGLTQNVTVPIVGAGAAIVKFGSDFEKAMTGSTAIMGNMSEEMQKKLETAAREVAKTTRFSATQAAESYFYLASAGLDAAQSIEALPRVAAFAQAGNFDMARATDLLTDAQSALGLAVDDTAKNMENMTRVSDVLVKGNVLANATVEQFSSALTNKAGAALRLLNKDVEEGVAVLAAWADQGVKGEAAGEQLNIVLRDLQNAALKNRKEFKQFGIDVFDASGNVRNIADVISDVEGALDGMSDAQVRTTLTTLGFQDRSVSALMTLLGTSDAIRSYEAELRKAGGTTGEVAAKQIQNLQDQLGLLKDRLIDSALTMYETLGPTIENVIIPGITGFIEKVESLVGWFASLDEGTQANILRFIAMAAAAGPVLLVAGNLTGAVGTLAKAAGGAAKFIGIKTAAGSLTAATTAMGTASATAAGSTGLLAGGLSGLISPAGLAVAGIALVGYGAYKLHQHMRQDAIPAVRDFGDEVSDSTKKAMGGFLDLYDEADRSLKQLAWSGGKVSGEMAENLTRNFNDMSEQIIAGLETSRKEGIASLEKLFAGSKNISEEEQAAMLESLNKGYDDRISTIEEKNARILEIWQTASDERRGITKAEQREIDGIREEMKNTAISTMSESELEQKAILERMKIDAEALTARQAVEIAANSREQADKAIEEAERLYNDAVKQFIFMRDETGDITTEQADTMIREAKRQYEESVKYAEEMHTEVVKQAEEMLGEYGEAVDLETGTILSKWEVFKNSVNRILGGIKTPSVSIPKAAQPNYSGLAGLNAFDDGGTVPGPIGSPQLVIAHGGETFIPTHKPGYNPEGSGSPGGKEVNISIVNNNPKPETGTESARKNLLKLAYIGMVD